MTATLTQSDPLTLTAQTAADLMMANPISLRSDATIAEALRLFTQKGIAAAPVIDEAGHPIGVLSRSDLLVHQREMLTHAANAPYYQEAHLEAAPASSDAAAGRRTVVADLMTPAVFAVGPEATARRVVAEMLALRVHRLFVVDENGLLLGVISAMDILRNLE